MRVLLDTHAFIWFDGEPKRLPRRVLSVITDPDCEVYLSVASVWEMQIKSQAGKLMLARPLEETIISQRDRNGVRILPILYEHVVAVGGLPDTHKDPFDRMLVAQARVEGLTLISRDPAFAGYAIPVFW